MQIRELVHWALVAVILAFVIIDFAVRGAHWAPAVVGVAVVIDIFVRPGGLWRRRS